MKAPRPKKAGCQRGIYDIVEAENGATLKTIIKMMPASDSTQPWTRAQIEAGVRRCIHRGFVRVTKGYSGDIFEVADIEYYRSRQAALGKQREVLKTKFRNYDEQETKRAILGEPESSIKPEQWQMEPEKAEPPEDKPLWQWLVSGMAIGALITVLITVLVAVVIREVS